VSATHYLQTPLSEADVRRLNVGDLVYLTGEIVITAGLPTHARILDHVQTGKALPLDLSGAVLLQFGGMSREEGGGLEVVYMNPTTSTRFNDMMPTIIRQAGLRAVGGKGGLDARSTRAMQECGCVYLSFPGGGCTLYTNAIRDVLAVEWQDLIPHYRLVCLRVENLGPGTVGIDAHGNNLYDGLQRQAEDRMPQIRERLRHRREADDGN